MERILAAWILRIGTAVVWGHTSRAHLLQAQRRRSLELLALRPGERVLVVGCGTGLDLEWIPAGVETVAGDLTPAMVERTRARAARLGTPVEARTMGAQALDVPDASFDAVVLHLILAVVPDPVAAIREAERVLRPGGRAAVFGKWVPDGREPAGLGGFFSVALLRKPR